MNERNNWFEFYARQYCDIMEDYNFNLDKYLLINLVDILNGFAGIE